MTPAIIRKFARYHDVPLVFGQGSIEWALEELARKIHGSLQEKHVLLIVQALTRIEDAEAIRAPVAAGPIAWADPYNEARRDAYHELLALAGIDLARWAKVTE